VYGLPKVVIAGNEYEVTGTGEEIVKFILEKAAELGWASVRIFADGKVVPEGDVQALEQASTIEVVKADVAA